MRDAGVRAVLDRARYETKGILSRKFAAIGHHDLRHKLEICEDEVKPTLKQWLLQLLHVLIKDSALSGASLRLSDGSVLRVAVSSENKDRIRPPSLDIIVFPDRRLGPCPTLEQWAQDDTHLPAFGRIKKCDVQLCTPPFSTQDLALVMELVQIVFHEASQWFYATTLNELSIFSVGAASALYGCLDRTLSAESKVTDDIWFSVFQGSYGVYLLRSRVIKSIYEELCETSLVLPLGPSVSLTHLIGLVMPYKLSLSQEAIKAGVCQTFSLPKRAKYAHNKDPVFRVEQVMIRQDEVPHALYSVYPIARIGDWSLVAAFPEVDAGAAGYKELLSQHRDELERIFKDNLSAIERHALHVRQMFPEHTTLRKLFDYANDLVMEAPPGVRS